MGDFCPTIRVVAGDSFAIINAVDFDPAIHERFEGDDTPIPVVGPYDGWSRLALITALTDGFKADMDRLDDDDLRDALFSMERYRQRRDEGDDLFEGLLAGKPAINSPAVDLPPADPAAPLEQGVSDVGADDTLYGSSVLDAIVTIGDLRVQLGGVVRASFTESGLSVQAWNDLPEADREGRLAATIERLTQSPEAAAAEIDPATVMPPLNAAAQVEIADGWKDLHWTKRVAMAQAIADSDETLTAEQANGVITAELARRAAGAEGGEA